MTNNSQIKRLDIGKVAMFGLLAISLLVAAIVVSNSRRAKLSKPITITPAGISVSVPASGRWQRNSSEFSYAKNSFVLAATMHISAAERIQLHWQYSLAPSVTDTAAALTARAEMIDGVVTETRQENIDGLPLTIATISSPANAITMLTAIVPTDVGHVLSLDMVQNNSMADFSQRIFKQLVKSIKIETPAQLTNGMDRLANFKNTFFYNPPRYLQGPKYYRVNDLAGNSLGFVVDGFSTENPDDTPLAAASIYYLGATQGYAQQTLFISDATVNSYKWVTDAGTVPTGQQVTVAIETDPNGMMQIKSSATHSASLFSASKTQIPDILLSAFISDFIVNNSDPVFIDILLSEGRILPAAISQSTQPDNLDRNDIAYTVDLKFLDGSGYSQQIFLDSSRDVVFTQINSQTNYTVSVADAESIKSEFAVWIPQIQKIEEYLK